MNKLLNSNEVTKEELERLYITEHRTMQEIGDLLGCTRQNVFFKIHRFGIDVSKAERFNAVCDVCGQEYEVTRKLFNKSIRHFCSAECYRGYLRNTEYRQNRTGQRLGRYVMERVLERDLRFGEVVHHIDGNDLNNDPENLMLFANHGEHLKYHHKVRQGNL